MCRWAWWTWPRRVSLVIVYHLSFNCNVSVNDWQQNFYSSVASWELRVEGRLLDDSKNDPNKVKRKFSSFFKSLVIELDKELYGPDNHLVEWHRTLTTQETDGFQVNICVDSNILQNVAFSSINIGETTWRQKRQMHHFVAVGLSAITIQTWS